MKDVRAALADFDCASVVRSAALSLVEAAPSVHLWEGTSDAYVALAGGADSAVGVYVNKSRLSIALEPAQAKLAGSRHSLPVEGKKTTGYVFIDPNRLGDAGLRAVAVDLGLQALEHSLTKFGKHRRPDNSRPRRSW